MRNFCSVDGYCTKLYKAIRNGFILSNVPDEGTFSIYGEPELDYHYGTEYATAEKLQITFCPFCAQQIPQLRG